MSDIARRDFIKTTAATGAALGVIGTSKTSWAGANDRIRIAILGVRGRGKDHAQGWNNQENVEVATICDVDTRLFNGHIKNFHEKEDRPSPKVEQDMRKVFDDPDIDAVSIATPNHWHSLAAIWAMEAGKHVYVEKPCSHNIFEGRQLVNAARKYKRVCQHGTQIRSSGAIREAMQLLHDGVIGEVYLARGLCYRWRPSIGIKEDSAVPDGVDYDMWLGPAPERAYNRNRFHYNWHYGWDYGNGDIGNQGVHQMDICRWGLGVDMPSRISSMSGMYIFDDQKEVPNVISTSYDFPNAGKKGKMMQFDVRPWMTNDEKGATVGVLFYGSDGYMVIDSYTHYQVYLGRKEEKGPSRRQGGDHYANFIKAVRKNKRKLLNAEIEEGHYSSALCHLGLISAKLGRSLDFDPKTERFKNDAEANGMITRDYRAPFVVPEIKA
ncbi:MAG: oxidoreductase [Candidatus Hydrogenedentota bacterium]|nr:MAG: oxidoreductase [Candidatus Hydrogenedentota bacterium]